MAAIPVAGAGRSVDTRPDRRDLQCRRAPRVLTDTNDALDTGTGSKPNASRRAENPRRT
jgi:hypothetical protein